MNNKRTILLTALLSIITAIVVIPDIYKKTQVQMINEALPKTVMVYAGFRVKRLVMRFNEETNTFYFKEIEVNTMVSGAGVFVTENGHILTAAHVLQVSTTPLGVQVELFNGESYKAEVLNVSLRSDLALIKVDLPKPSPYVYLADSRKLRVGQEVISIGNPLGFTFTVTHGVISAMNVDMYNGYNFIQADSSMNPGNSGGPLLNLAGELVGINSRIVPPVNAPIFTGLGFAVSTDQIREYLVLFRNLGR